MSRHATTTKTGSSATLTVTLAYHAKSGMSTSGTTTILDTTATTTVLVSPLASDLSSPPAPFAPFLRGLNGFLTRWKSFEVNDRGGSSCSSRRSGEVSAAEAAEGR